jgi:hypothetical protein
VANNRVFEDKDGDIWIEHPAGSRMFLCIDGKVITRLASKYEVYPVTEVTDQFGPIREMTS